MFVKLQLLMAQAGLDYRMFEDAVRLPRGFLDAFNGGEPASEGMLQVIQGSVMRVFRELRPW